MRQEHDLRPQIGEWREANIQQIQVIKDFILKIYRTPLEEQEYSREEFSSNRPRGEDITAIHSGDFELRQVEIFQEQNGRYQFSCYVGETQLIITGKAAKDLAKKLRGEDSQ
ncbi:MAG: hypothetical protein A2233_02035 [Candidatus Kerfeldbacteria bacterium RIFOXYA2_FULL_38_24]|uniref:Uncharacterized protein n=1 Tax=Candidatus Kerfeldbacteria bacterium RIFOXYB2_FULL_38_14 TaxID=1798547 RepID=A0A1G2BF81_9BACT|nr:MAG: hypothetical protein A2319_04635 [Candidatus Kerfeldbacteria bacterium RIFOXYB2_FULL_38_14]OGY87895.1 MAG: hypothetical protein A2233_02035 [Candidatus Kerfeldbacteria bacterium RIFOXYA2_FULL_38_24]OGY88690.1 MAG: hypothetical protein A2458_03570 [Candidatus Kerfeldbacteria bacterium RIFOXYC2_FULL_38_9]